MQELKRLREKANIKISDLAEQIGTSDSLLYHIENGSRKPSLITLLNLCEVFNVTPNDLLGYEIKDKDPRHIELLYEFDKLTEDQKDFALQFLKFMNTKDKKKSD